MEVYLPLHLAPPPRFELGTYSLEESGARWIFCQIKIILPIYPIILHKIGLFLQYFHSLQEVLPNQPYYRPTISTTIALLFIGTFMQHFISTVSDNITYSLTQYGNLKNTDITIHHLCHHPTYARNAIIVEIQSLVPSQNLWTAALGYRSQHTQK